MAIMEQNIQKNQREDVQNIIIESRRRISVSGVEDVDSFDECDMILQTTMGTLSIKGEGLHIIRMSVEMGELSVEGEIQSLQYNNIKQQGGMFSRHFR